MHTYYIHNITTANFFHSTICHCHVNIYPNVVSSHLPISHPMEAASCFPVSSMVGLRWFPVLLLSQTVLRETSCATRVGSPAGDIPKSGITFVFSIAIAKRYLPIGGVEEARIPPTPTQAHSLQLGISQQRYWKGDSGVGPFVSEGLQQFGSE